MGWMRTLYGMRAGWKTINNRLLSHGYCVYRPTRKPLLTANHCHLCLESAQGWKNLTMAHWQHVIFGDKSRSQLYLVDGRLRVCRLPDECFQYRCQVDRVQAVGGFAHVWGAFHSGANSPLLLPDRYLTSQFYRGILRNTLVPFARQHFGDNYCYQDDNATPYRAWFPSAERHNQNGAACKITRLQPHRTYLGGVGPCNHQYGRPAQESWRARPSLNGYMGRKP